MKKHHSITLILSFTIALFILESCKKESDPPIFDDTNIEGVMMTLSAIAYVADSTPAIIKDSIRILLNDKTLATGGNWELVWGPGITTNNENLVYVTRHIVGSTTAYAIAIRGTNVHSLEDIFQDAMVFTLREFTFGQAGDSVSHGAWLGFNELLVTTDSLGTTLEQYLKSVTTDQKIPLYVTGHSLGGGLAPLMAYWLVTNNELKDKFVFSTFAFAGPSVINKGFRDHFLSALPADASFQMSINSLDLVPYGWSDLPGIITNQIPVPLPHDYINAINGVHTLLEIGQIKYYNVVVADTIGHIPVPADLPNVHPTDSAAWFDYWLLKQHTHDSYLELLGAKPLS